MLNMMRADLYRFFHSKKFKGCLLFTFIWVISCGLLQQGTLTMREAAAGVKINIDYWESFWGYHPVLIPLIVFCCIEYATDFKQKTIKLYVAKGISKWSFFFSKIFMGWLVAFIFVGVALLSGMLCDMILWGGSFSAFLSVDFMGYLLGQWLFHGTAATFIISLVFFMRGNAVCTVVNLLLLIFGYALMHKFEMTMGHDGLITNFWVYSYINGIEMESLTQTVIRVALLFAGYFAVFGMISGIIFHKRDVE